MLNRKQTEFHDENKRVRDCFITESHHNIHVLLGGIFL